MYDYQAKIVKVIDADTVDVMIDLGFNNYTRKRLRLAYIDAPERYTADGKVSKKWLVDHLTEASKDAEEEGKPELIVNTNKKGKFGRWISVIWVYGEDKSINDKLLELGLVKEYKY